MMTWAAREDAKELVLLKERVQEYQLALSIAQGLKESAQTTARLMLQEREFFAKQIRDIREVVAEKDYWAEDNYVTQTIRRILARPNPMP